MDEKTAAMFEHGEPPLERDVDPEAEQQAPRIIATNPADDNNHVTFGPSEYTVAEMLEWLKSETSVIYDTDMAEALIAALERAEELRRVELHAGRLIERIDEFESCLRDRGVTQAPCHGVPLRGVFDVRDVLRACLEAKP